MIGVRQHKRGHRRPSMYVIDALERRRLLVYNIEFSQYITNQTDIGGVQETPLVGDFNRDGRDDIGVYIPNGSTNARWVLKFNQGNGVFNSAYNVDRMDLGGVGEIPIVGDFNGDQRDDIGIYIPNGGTNARWVVKFNLGGGTFATGAAYDIDRVDLGGVGETPIVGDFNRDGLDDIGIYIPNGSVNARWVIKFNKGGGTFNTGAHYDIDLTSIGGVSETPFVGDFNGDGADDLGVYIPNGTTDALWAVAFNRGTGSFPPASDVKRRNIGGSAEKPVVGAFDSESGDDLGVYIPNGNSNARWAIKHIGPVEIFRSNTTATTRLELDFDGAAIGTWNGASVGVVPPYDTDGDLLHFNDNERAAIAEIWARVAEKFSPFNVDVTTGDSGLLRDKQEYKVVIGGDGAWYNSPTTLGVSLGGSFAGSGVNIAFAFSDKLSTKGIAEVAAHEAGHGYGLEHQKPAGGSHAEPIMEPTYGDIGATYRRWWNGTINPADGSGSQIDWYVLGNVGVSRGPGLRSDDRGGSPSTAAPMGQLAPDFTADGIIGGSTGVNDVDYFSFDLATPRFLKFSVAAASKGAMLEPKVTLMSESGTALTAQSTLPSGRYFFRVEGAPQVVDTGGANIGQYLVSGNIYAPPQLVSAGRNANERSIFATFANDVGPYLTRSMFSLLNLQTGQFVNMDNFGYSYSAATRTAKFFTYGLPAAPYQLRFSGGLVDVHGGYFPQDADGTQLLVGFSFRDGDVNSDGRVNFDDLVILAQNYGSTGRTYSQGNLNYSPDGKVDFEDLIILAQNYGSAASAGQILAAAQTSDSPMKPRKDRSFLDLV